MGVDQEWLGHQTVAKLLRLVARLGVKDPDLVDLAVVKDSTDVLRAAVKERDVLQAGRRDSCSGGVEGAALPVDADEHGRRVLRCDVREQLGVVAADLEDDAAVEWGDDAAVEEGAPCAALLKLRSIAEHEIAELEQPVGVGAAATDGHFTTSFANARARSSASGSLAGSLPPACAICG